MSYLPKEQRRAKIIAAAVDVILHEGLSAATVRRVAKSISVSPGQIHHHFESANALRAEAFLEMWHQLADDYISKIEVSSPVERIIVLVTGGDDPAVKDIFRRMYEDLVEASRGSAILQQTHHFIMRTNKQQYVDMLEEAQQAGELSDQVNIDRLAISLMAMSFGSCFLHDAGLADYDPRALIVHQIELENKAAIAKTAPL